MLKLKPVFKEMIWGGSRLRNEFGFTIPSNKTGEAWVVSSHPDGASEVVFEDTTFALDALYEKKREMFGIGQNKKFPLMIKIIDASKDLSIQVHPDDEYAQKYENSYGKNESWYILDCPSNHRIVMGHYAKNRDELSTKLRNNDVDDLFRTITINPSDCFDVSAGTIHAICEDTLVYEVQQNSNVTYRIFDYNRKGLDGKPRELHIEKSIDVSDVPSTPDKVLPKVTEEGTTKMYHLVSNEYFEFNKVSINESFEVKKSDYFVIVGVESGNGMINNTQVSKGEHFILLPHELPLNITGQLSIFVTIPKEKSML